MERLARLAEQLLASVEAFKLRENANYYAPTSNTRITLEEEQNNQLSFSNAFRTITATAQSSNAEMYNGAGTRLMPPLAPTYPPDRVPANAARGSNRFGSNGPTPPQSPHPATPNQQNKLSRTPLRSIRPE